MKSGSTYVPLNDFSLLLIGPPLTGKTNVALQFPDPWIFSTDRKVQNAVGRVKPAKWWFTYSDETDDGQVVHPDNQWLHLTENAKQAAVNPEVKTLVFDHGTDMAQILLRHVIRETSGKAVGEASVKPEIQHYNPFADLFRRFISTMKRSKKFVILVIHEMIEKDEGTGTMVYRPLIPGQLRDNLGGLFTNVWRTEIVAGPTGAPQYIVRAQPTPRNALGNSLNLPPTFTFSWPLIEKALQSTTATSPASPPKA